MTNELTKEQEKRLDEAFFLIDQDNDKAISINEVGLLLRALGIFISESDIEKMKSKLGNEGELVSYDEFKNYIVKRIVEQHYSTSLTAMEFDIPIKTLEKWITAYNKNPNCFTSEFIVEKQDVSQLMKKYRAVLKDNDS